MIRIISANSFQVYAFVVEFYNELGDWPRSESIFLHFRDKPRVLAISMEILQRHHFLKFDRVSDRYQAVGRKPLLMPFKGVVR